MNEGYWQLRAASRNYFDSHQITTRMGNRIKALARAGHYEPVLDQQFKVAEEGRKEIGKQLTLIYRKQAPEAIRKFQSETTGLGELYVAQLVGVVGDFRTYTEAWWEETSSQPVPDSHKAVVNGHTGSSSHGKSDSQRTSDSSQMASDSQLGRENSPDSPDSQFSSEKRILVTGAVIPCGVRDIWSYCGHGDASRRRKRGMAQDDAFAAGNPLAKSIVHMMADFSCRLNGVADKNGRPRAMSPYYPLYINTKSAAAENHLEDWTPKHCQNHAFRIVGKAILKDFWRVQHDELPVYGEVTPWARRAEQPDLQ